MFIQPSLTQNQVDVILPVGEYISIGNTGNESTTVLLQSVATSAQPWNYSTIGTLFNTAKTFGPYTEERTIRIDNRNATVEYSISAQPQLRSFPELMIKNKGPIGLVEPAGTFVTLTYNNNAGKVRLNSAGAHGLTAAVAVGENVYVTWSGGTGVTGLYPVTALDTDTTGTAVTIDLAYRSATATITIAAPVWSLGQIMVCQSTTRFASRPLAHCQQAWPSTRPITSKPCCLQTPSLCLHPQGVQPLPQVARKVACKLLWSGTEPQSSQWPTQQSLWHLSQYQAGQSELVGRSRSMHFSA
jgi:hypothetical protein